MKERDIEALPTREKFNVHTAMHREDGFHKFGVDDSRKAKRKIKPHNTKTKKQKPNYKF